MKLQTFNRLFAIAALATASAVMMAPAAMACGGCGCSAKKEKPSGPTGDIVETAASAGVFNTLLAAAEAAGLVETLQSEGPLTVIAPTDAAFAKLPEGTVESLLKPENKDKLVAVLTYHVIPGKIDSKAAMKAGTAKTVQGGELTFEVVSHGDHDHAQVNGVNIIKTDIETTNGMIHVVDAVLLPAE